jgi:hypothetical protein
LFCPNSRHDNETTAAYLGARSLAAVLNVPEADKQIARIKKAIAETEDSNP